MNIYSLLLFTSFLIYLSLGLRMFKVRPMSRMSILFCQLCFAFAFWSFCITFLFSAPHKEAAFFWFKLASPSWSLIPALMLHFVFVLTGWEQKIRQRWLLLFLYLPGILFAWKEITSYVLAIDFSLESYGWTGINPTDSPWFLAFTAYYLLYVLFSAAVLYRWKEKTDSPREKQQAKIIIIAVLLSVVLTFFNETLLPGMGIDLFPKIPSFLTLIWAYGMWYAINRYRLMKASPALTGEIVLEELLSKLLQTVMENSGAQRVVIIIQQEKQMLIQGEAYAGIESSKVLHNIPLEESNSLPLTVLDQVIKNRKNLLLDDIRQEHAFSADPYLLGGEHRSLLVIPLLTRGILKGLIYLENNQTTHAFTPERVQGLNVLTSEIVISLQNATLFASLQESYDRMSEWNQLLEQTVQERTNAVRNLLNNAGQGFLTFDRDLLVDDEYSAECENIFGAAIAGTKISRLLFPANEEEQSMLEEIIGQIYMEKEAFKQEVYLSLLPDEVQLDGQYIRLEFKLIKNSLEEETEDLLMLILTGITEKRKLEETMQEEKNLFEMIVRVVSNFVDFNATLKEYEEFCCNYIQEIDPAQDPVEIFTIVMRSIHTFKGSFHQFGMLNMVKMLHQLETKLQQQSATIENLTTADILGMLAAEDMEKWLEEDLLILKTFLGDTYFLRENSLIIDVESLWKMEECILTTLTPPQIQLILPELRKMLWKPFRESLKAYPDYIKRLSSQTEKLICPLEIEGGNINVDLELYRDFVKSLGHIFRNALDHGIEPPEERVAAGKNERGKIHCRVSQKNGCLIVKISDDGRGIPIEKIREKALQINMPSFAVPDSEQELLQLIFEDQFSTQETLSDLSGRGVGLSAVKSEVEKLGGSVEVNSRPGEGTTFSFYLPLENGTPLKKPSYFEIIQLFLQSARNILHEQTGVNIDTPSDTNLKVADHVELLDIMTIMPLRGVITGKIILTANRELCSYMLDNYAMWKVEEAERENCYNDLLAELLNIITGSFLNKVSGGEFVVTGTPQKIQAENACLKNNGNEILTYQVAVENGILSFSFISDQEVLHCIN